MRTFKKFAFLVFAFVLVLQLASCGVQGGDSFTITFDTVGGNAIASMEVEWGTEPEIPTPTKNGYTFDGWYLNYNSSNNSYSNEYTDDYVFTDSITLYAKWIVNKYTVTYMVGDTVYQSLERNYGQTISVTNPSLEHMTFKGWFTNDEFTSAFNGRVPSSNITVYAKFVPNQVTIRFESNGADDKQSMDNVTLVYGQNTTLPLNEFSIEGFSFAGWSLSLSEAEVAYADGATYTELDKEEASITLYAVWQPLDYTVNFFSNNEKFAETTGAFLSSVKYPESDPALAGYRFTGWYYYALTKDTTFSADKVYYTKDGSVYQVAEVVTGSEVVGSYYEFVVATDDLIIPLNGMNIYAKFTANHYTINYAANLGSGTMDKQVVTYNEEARLSANLFTRTGYTFQGWAKEADGEVVYGNEAVVKNLLTEGEVILYAKWSANQYTVSFNGNGGLVPADSQTKVITYDQVFGLLPTPTRAGYTFAGWFLDTSEVTSETKVAITENITLVAKWTANTDTNYQVQYYLENLDGNGYYLAEDLTEALQGETDTTVELTLATVKAVKGFTATLNDSQVLSGQINANGSLVLKVYYDRNTYQVTFRSSLTNELIEEVTLNVLFDNQINAYPKALDKAGYTYVVTLNDKAFDLSSHVLDNVELKVLYTANSYKVQFNKNANDASGEMSQLQLTYDSAINLTLNGYSRLGYTFKGWATTSDGEVAYTDGSEVKNLTTALNGTVNLYAIWQVNKYTISFDTKGGNLIADITLDYGTSLTAPADPEKAGYTFAGWDKQMPKTMPAENVQLTANWNLVTYKLNYELNDGQLATLNPTTYNVETLSFTLVNPTREGYTFAGWTGAGLDKATLEVTIETGSLGDKLFVATWTANTDTKYVVEHYTQDLNNEGLYTKKETVNLTGTTDETVNASALTLNGFTFDESNTNNVLSGKVLANGSLVLKVYYSRNLYNVKFVDASSEAEIVTKQVKYEGNLGQLPTELTKAGHNYSLTLNGEAFTAETTITENADVVVTYVAREHAIIYNNVPASTNPTFVTTQEVDFGVEVTLSAVLKTGYSFAGWATVENGDVVYAENDKLVMPDEDVNLYAIFTANTNTKYVVKHLLENVNNNEYTLAETEELTGTSDAKVTPEVKDYEGFNAPSATEVTILADESLVVEYKYTRKQVTISFDSKGGSLVSSITLKYGASVTAPLNPTRAGYTFANWSQEVPTTMPANDLALEALWTEHELTINFIKNNEDATGEMSQLVFSYTSVATLLTENQFKYVGYHFAGWLETAGSNTVKYADHAEINVQSLIANESKEISLYAKWDANTDTKYVVNYYLENADDAGYTLQATEELVGTTGQLVNAPSKSYEGFTFDSSVEGTITSGNVLRDGSLVLSLYYTRNVYTISFDSLGGTNVESITQKYGSKVVAPLNPTKVGYSFTGWNQEVPATMPLNGASLTATWTINQYTLKFYLVKEGVSFDESLTYDSEENAILITADYNSAVVMPTVSLAGTEFIGWSKTFENMPVNGAEIYANWASVNQQFKLTIYLIGTENKYLELFVEYGENLSLYAPKSDAYDFALYADKDGKVSYDLNNSTMPAQNLTLYLTQVIKTLTIKLNNNGTEEVVNVNYGQTYTFPTPTREGYVFGGWYEEGSTSGYFGGQTITVTANLELTAKYSDKDYTIVYYDGNGNKIWSTTGTTSTLVDASFMDYIDDLETRINDIDKIMTTLQFAIDAYLSQGSAYGVLNIVYLGLDKLQDAFAPLNAYNKLTYDKYSAYITKLVKTADLSGAAQTAHVTSLMAETPFLNIMIAAQAVSQGSNDLFLNLVSPHAHFDNDIAIIKGLLQQSPAVLQIEAFQGTADHNIITAVMLLSDKNTQADGATMVYTMDTTADGYSQYATQINALKAALFNGEGDPTSCAKALYTAVVTARILAIVADVQYQITLAENLMNQKVTELLADANFMATPEGVIIKAIAQLKSNDMSGASTIIGLDTESSQYSVYANEINAAKVALSGYNPTDELTALYMAVLNNNMIFGSDYNLMIFEFYDDVINGSASSLVNYLVYYSHLKATADGKLINALPASLDDWYTPQFLALFPDFPNKIGSSEGGAISNAVQELQTVYQEIFTKYKLNAYYPAKENAVFDHWVITPSESDDSIINYTAVWKEQLKMPKDVKVDTFKKENVSFTWNEVEDAAGYRVTYTINGSSNQIDVATNSILIAVEDGDVVVLSVMALGNPETVTLTTVRNGETLNAPTFVVNSEESVEVSYTHSVNSDDFQVDGSGSTYYYDKNSSKYLLFTSQSYNFGTSKIEMLEDPNNIANISVANGQYYLVTGSATGSISFRVTKFDGSEYQDYIATVQPIVQNIVAGSSLKAYTTRYEQSGSGNATFINKSENGYSVGTTNNYDNGYSYELENGTVLRNGFVLDFVATTTSGINTVIDYDVKVTKDGTTVNNYEYDYKTNTIYFDKGTTGTYTITVSPKKDIAEEGYINLGLPNMLKNKVMEASFTVNVNDGVNVYTDEQLRKFYGDLTVTTINLQSDIIAKLAPVMAGYYQYMIDEKFYGAGYVGNASSIKSLSELNVKNGTAVMLEGVAGNATYGPKIWVKASKAEALFTDVNGQGWKYSHNGEAILKSCDWEYVGANGTFSVLNDRLYRATSYASHNLQVAFIYQRYNANNISNVEGEPKNNLVIYGNYFNIDGSKLPYMNSNYSNVAGSLEAAYKIQNVQTAIFGVCTTSVQRIANGKMTKLAADGTREYVDGSGKVDANLNVYVETNVTFNDMSIESNTMDVSAWFAQTNSTSTSSIADYMAKTSGGYNGILVTQVDDETKVSRTNPRFALSNAYVNNVFIKNSLIALFTSMNGSVISDYVHLKQTWANSLYSFGGHLNVFNNSLIETSGGGAVHIEDIYAIKDNSYIVNPVAEFNNTVVENYIAGDEQWFKAYNMSVMALGMKSAMETQMNANGFTIIKTEYDTVTGQQIDKMNLVALGKLPVIEDGVITETEEQELYKSDIANEYLFDGFMQIPGTDMWTNGQKFYYVTLQQAAGMNLYIVTEAFPMQ